ncbi:MAG: hypothetical protein IIV86_04470 [Bacteroidaceae bacterium]|nr:hypothetical protein [Bacteroidaceae bacterium]
MSYLETIGAKPCLHDQQEGYMEGIEGTVPCEHPCCPNYMESIEECNCANLEPEREKGYLGWFLNLAECLEAFPNPRKGMTYNNVETRSVWIYDGAHWRNTTQGNPFHLIYDIENAGEVKRGYAQSFYYVPTEEDVKGGTITFHFLVDGEDMWVECDVEYLSDIVLIEWNGSDFVSRVRSLDDRTAFVKDGKVVDSTGQTIVDVSDIIARIAAETNRAEAAEAAIERSVVKHTSQSLTETQKNQARANIGAASQQVVAGLQSEVSQGFAWLSENTVQSSEQKLTPEQKNQARRNIEAVGVAVELEDFGGILEFNSQTIYPRTQAKNVYAEDGQTAQEKLDKMVTTFADGLLRNDTNGQFYPRTTAERVRVGEQNLQEYLSGLATPEDIEQIKDAAEKITSIVDEEGYVVSNGERVDMRFTRSLLPVGTEIVASANLNTIEYLKVGKYYCRQNATAKTVKNCPVNVAFSMEVFNPLSPTYDDETTTEYTYRVRVLTQYDTGQQYMQFCRTSGTPGKWTYDSWYVTPRTLFTLASSKNDGTAALGSGTQGIYVDSTGTLKKMTYTLAKSVPSSAVFTDTKVTAVGNHYTPAENAEAALEATEGEFVTGVKRDAAGHVVGVASSAMLIDGKSVPEYVESAISEAIGTALNTPI